MSSDVQIHRHSIFQDNWPYSEKTPASVNENLNADFPKISIIIPSYNQGNFIEETLLSIINQKYPNTEIIVIDGGSQDNTPEIIQKYASHINYHISEKDQGQSDAINKGLEKVSGEIINWICSDDLLLPGALFALSKAFEDPEVQVVCGWSRQFYQQDDLGLACTTLYKSLPELLYLTHVCQPATWYRKHTLEGLKPLNTELHYTMDSEWWLLYLLKNKLNGVKEIPFVISGYRYHDQSKTVMHDTKFRNDKLQLTYPVLLRMEAPAFFTRLYESFNKSLIPEKLKSNEVHPDINKKEVLLYYSRKTLSFCKVRGKYLQFLMILLYHIYLKPMRSFREYLNLLKQDIAPKFFQ